MPEGPEVKMLALALAEVIHGKELKDVDILHPSVGRHSKLDLEKISGLTVEKIFVIGKVIIIDLGQKALTIQLGMAGSFSWKRQQATASVRIGPRILFFNDSRRFGSWCLWEAYDDIKPVSKLGPEVLSKKFNANHLLRHLRNRKTSIKPLLLNQTVVCGIGNMYASEILLRAGLHPETKVSTLKGPIVEKICASCKEVISEAEHNFSAMPQFITKSRPVGGWMWKRLRIYQKKFCLRCGSKTKHIRQSGRSTWFCPECQPITSV